MNFEHSVICIAAFLYAAVAVSFLLKGQYAWCMIWLCYSLANFGLMIVKK